MGLHRSLAISSDAAVAGICLAFLSLTAILVVLCKKKDTDGTADTDTDTALLARSVALSDVDAATDGFHPSRFIGKGRLGTVYKAITALGDVFAVKRIHPNFVLRNAGVGFAPKIRSLSFANHPNVVPILGYCEAPGERIVITELVVSLWSLDHYLHGRSGSSAGVLDWRLRLRVAAGAARGVEHLHEANIVHGRVRSSNIMVDGGFCARVCDYGISFLGPNEHGGYWDGEGWDECKAGDVFGFGVVLLELLSGRRWEGGVIVKWALPLIRGSRVGDVLDARVGAPFDVRPLVRMAKVASTCVGNGRKSRPSIAQVAAILNDLEMQASS